MSPAQTIVLPGWFGATTPHVSSKMLGDQSVPVDGLHNRRCGAGFSPALSSNQVTSAATSFSVPLLPYRARNARRMSGRGSIRLSSERLDHGRASMELLAEFIKS